MKAISKYINSRIVTGLRHVSTMKQRDCSEIKLNLIQAEQLASYKHKVGVESVGLKRLEFN